jgi:predicted metal-dependent peptidase
MVEYAPATGGLALWVQHADAPAAAAAAAAAVAVPLIATDGQTIYYGPAFATLSLPEQVGCVAHEVLHIALRHPQRYRELCSLLGDADRELFNRCADAIVNSTLSHLSWLRLPPKAVSLDQLLTLLALPAQAIEKSLLEWDVERLYRALDDRDGRAKDGERSARVRALGSGGDADLLPTPGGDDAPELESERAREWSERVLRAHAGDGEYSMLRTLLADLPKTRTPWELILRTLLARGLAPKRAVSWSRPTRSYIANQGRFGARGRLPWEPGFSASKPTPRLAVIVDVSGSIEEALMERFAREIEAITRRLEAGLVLIVGDDRVRHVAEFAPGRSDLREMEFLGGGGTDFTPLLEEAERHRPDICVVLTDLEGPARRRPRWPVIWAVPEVHRAARAPFGRKLVLE